MHKLTLVKALVDHQIFSVQLLRGVGDDDGAT